MRAITPTRCLAVLIALSCLLVFALVPRYDLLEEGPRTHVARGRRGLFDPLTPPTPTPTNPTNSNSAGDSNTSSADKQSTQASQPSSTQNAQSNSQASPSPTQASNQPSNNQPSNTASSTPNNNNSQSASQAPSSSPDAQSSQQPTPTPTPTPTSSQVVSTGVGGQVITTFVVVSQTPSDTSTSATSTSTSGSDNSGGGDSGISSSTIIGISVAGGVALIGIVAFFVWKFTHKRFSDLDGDEAIKWPDLNTHGEGAGSVPLPTNQTGRAGYDTGSEAALSRANSHNGGYAGSLAATSTTELYPGGAPDPYAVPPLPHMNPNQPYRDEPDFYDPYRGPVPQTFGDGAEAIPMTQMAARARSPGPGALYDVGVPGRSGSPAPSMGGRRSPAPQVALGYGDAPPGMYAPGAGPGMVMDSRARSPGPGAGLAGPQAAYGYGR